QGNKKSGSGPELYNTQTKTAPEGLSTLPRDYTGVPQINPPPSGISPLGPPLPGDIGRPTPAAQAPGQGRRRFRTAAHGAGSRSSAHQPSVRHHQYKRAARGTDCSRCGPEGSDISRTIGYPSDRPRVTSQYARPPS